MSCFKYKKYIILKVEETYSVWKDDVKLEEFSSEKMALKFVDKKRI